MMLTSETCVGIFLTMVTLSILGLGMAILHNKWRDRKSIPILFEQEEDEEELADDEEEEW